MVDVTSTLILGMTMSNRATDVGTIGPMIDHVRGQLGAIIKKAHTDSGYSSLGDLKSCLERQVELVAPVQENSFTKKKQSEKQDQQLSRDLFPYDTVTHTYSCPAGHAMRCSTKEVRKQPSGDVVVEHFKQSKEKCQACPLVNQCLRGATKHRTIRRMVGQEIIDHHKMKMNGALMRSSREIRAQTVERVNADIKQRIGLRRFKAVTLKRAKACLAAVVFILNLMTVRRMLLESLKPMPQAT